MTKPKRAAQRPPHEPKKKSQPDDFISVARRMGADEDKARFEAKLAKIAKAKTAPAR